MASSSGHWVLTKLLANGDRAVVLFNATDKSALITTTVARIGLTGSAAYSVLNLWTGMTSKSHGQILARVAPHGVVMFVVTPMA